MKFILIVCVLWMASGCASIERQNDIYTKNIVGSWLLKDHGYDGAYTISLIAFTESGRKCVVATDYSLRYPGLIETTYWDNTWRIDNGFLITTITKSSGRYTKLGDIIRDNILALDKNNMSILMETESDYTPSLEDHVRLKGESTDRICSLIDKNFGA